VRGQPGGELRKYLSHLGLLGLRDDGCFGHEF
jgi:hypothetical protein